MPPALQAEHAAESKAVQCSTDACGHALVCTAAANVSAAAAVPGPATLAGRRRASAVVRARRLARLDSKGAVVGATCSGGRDVQWWARRAVVDATCGGGRDDALLPLLVAYARLVPLPAHRFFFPVAFSPSDQGTTLKKTKTNDRSTPNV